MQKVDLLLVQNVIARITHGLIGFDLFMQGKKDNDYLQDFLTLKDDDLREALLSASAKMELIPMTINISSEEKSIIETVKRAQQIAEKIDDTDSGQIDQIMTELEDKLNIFYRNVYR